jgi:hypothetical protein
MTLNSGNSAAHGHDPVRGDLSTLVLRAWLEPGDRPAALRVRVVEIGADRSERSVVVTTSVDHVLRTVSDWLTTLQAPGTDGPAVTPQ